MEYLCWFVDSLRQRPNAATWEDLLQRVRILIDTAADDAEKENEDPEEIEKAQGEDKAASTSDAQERGWFSSADEILMRKGQSDDGQAADDAKEENEDPDDPEEMKEAQVADKAASTSDAQEHGWFSPAAEILMRKGRSVDGQAADDAKEDNEDPDDPEEMKEAQAAFRRSCKVASLKHVATGPITSRSPRKTDACIIKPRDAHEHGWFSPAGETDGGRGNETEGPALKKMRQELGEGTNEDTKGIILQENLEDPCLKVRSIFPYSCHWKYL